MPNKKDSFNKADRAKIFLPYDTLKGFREALRKKEKIIVEKKLLSDDEKNRLSEKIKQVKKLSIIKVTYYNGEEYEEIKGLVSKIDTEYEHYMYITNIKIMFTDIVEISADYIHDDFSF